MFTFWRCKPSWIHVKYRRRRSNTILSNCRIYMFAIALWMILLCILDFIEANRESTFSVWQYWYFSCCVPCFDGLFSARQSTFKKWHKMHRNKKKKQHNKYASSYETQTWKVHTACKGFKWIQHAHIFKHISCFSRSVKNFKNSDRHSTLFVYPFSDFSCFFFLLFFLFLFLQTIYI